LAYFGDALLGFFGFRLGLDLSGFTEREPKDDAFIMYATALGRNFLGMINDDAEFSLVEFSDCEVQFG
jgi:hypothetical protein